jgi:NTP pyrophosphatase (non-canonical NTP hydrolase)
MDFTEYQTKSRKTAKYPSIGHGVIYPTLGLTNEAGEVAGKIKKIFRDKNGVIGEAERDALEGELGDVLWYLAQVCTGPFTGGGGGAQHRKTVFAPGARQDQR